MTHRLKGVRSSSDDSFSSMAITDKQAKMVVHQEGMTTPTLAPQTATACSLFVILKELQPGSGMQEEGHILVNRDASFGGKSTVGTGVTLSMPLSAMAATNTSNHLPAETTCKGITVTLDNNNMWNEFYRCQTEMILTKQGRRMFPYCRFRISGLEPFQRYTLAMDMHPADNYRYKWSDRRWETNGKSDPHIIRSFIHPESSATGLDWMQNPVSFYKLKLTNNTMDQDGHIIINSMHRYLPRLHIIPADKATDVLQLNGPDVITFSFPQTEFFAVTAYQNLSITQLKIDYNPFAKGFREDANSPRVGKPKNGLSTETVESESKPSRETTTLNNLKTLFAKRNAAEKVFKGEASSIPTNGDLKNVNSDTPLTTEPEKSSSKKRQWPGGLSELIRGAHVKVKRISLENYRNDQQKNTYSIPAGEKMHTPSKNCKSENIPVSEMEMDVEKPKKQTGATDFVPENQVPEVPITANTVSSAQASESFVIKHKGEQSSETKHVKSSLASKSILDIHEHEKVDSALPDDMGSTKEASQSTVTPPDCVEVKKKRAEPVPLPLLAHFLQQLKSKTRCTRPKLKSEVFSTSLPSDKSSDATSVAESLSPSTSAHRNTSSNQQPPISVTHETSSVTVASSSSFSTSVSSASLTRPLVALSDTLAPLSPSPPPVEVPDPSLISKHNPASTPVSVCETVSLATASAVPNAVPLSTPEDVPITSSALASSTVSTTSLSGPTLDTNVSTSPLYSSPDDAPICADAQNNDFVPNEATATDPTSDPAMDSSTPLCPELLSEDLPQSPLSDDDTNLAFSPSHTPSSPDCSVPSPTASSPDPFPPGLFSDRPIPPRKTLDPFSPYVSFENTRPPLDTPLPVTRSLFVTKPTLAKDPMPMEKHISCTETSSVPEVHPCTPTSQHLQESTVRKSKVKHRKSGKSKLNEDQEVTEGPVPVPMQPNLENVEGQLFVSFMSKKALKIHLGDDVTEKVSQETMENAESEISYSIEERIDELEKVLLRDLKIMKHRQVIHPVLQEVGLKLNLLDLTLAIDLQYLGVPLPIPPPVVFPGESSASQVLFVSRTGKTTDFTKIKGWREKFVPSSSSTHPGGNTSSDVGQKNLSAFCSDMLDEYLENEGKLIDERAASFSQASVSPVAYQLPTKSTSYVRTLDSVLKKQISPTTETPLTDFTTFRKSAAASKRKQVAKSEKNAVKKSSKFAKTASSTNKPAATSNSEALKVGESLSKKSTKSGKIKTNKGSKTLQASPLATERLAVRSSSVPAAIHGSSSGSNTTGGRSAGLPKTLVKLMDVEDGAVWEGKHRTCITKERATIALCSLFTTEGALRAVPSTIIKRRAPPCLNDFCRLGCVCSSLAQERRQHHCGKPQCMLGCDCLRRKVVLLKSEDEDQNAGPAADVCPSENESKVKRSKKRKMTYILSGSEAAPEPVTHVKTLWDRKVSDPETIFIPNPARPNCPSLLYPELQQDLEDFLYPSPKQVKHGESQSTMKDKTSKMTCARVRPFCRRKPAEQSDITEGHQLSSQDSLQEMEEGELRPPTLSGPFKRLEIVSKCEWATAGSRNVVLRVVCEHMAQDRLTNPFWIGKYRIEPTSKAVQETEEGTTITYKVVISQPHVMDNKKKEDERMKHLEAQLIKTIGKSEVKGLPLLSRVASAGLLKAEIKRPGAQGQITVNGKPYPQAKLELGQMGALHPANRLAAYITGRVCPANQQANKTVTSTSKTPPSAPSTTTTEATTTTTTVTNTQPADAASVKPTVAKPPGGTVYAQVVISHINSQQQKLPMTSASRLQGTIRNIIHSTSTLTGATGVSLSTKTPPKLSMASQIAGGSIQVVKKIPVSGSAVPQKPPVTVSAAGPCTAPPNAGARLAQLAASVRPPAPGQRMVFQMLKTAKGNTLYRNPNGQIIQLVPLSQYKALNPNFVLNKQTTLVRLPSPSSPSKPQTSSHAIVDSPASQTKSATKAQLASVHSAPTVSVTTDVTSSVVVKPSISLSGSRSFLISNQPSTVKITGFSRDAGTTNLRIIPQIKIPKAATDPRNTITTSLSSDPCSSDVATSDKNFVLLTPQSCETTQSQDINQSDNTFHVSPPDPGSQQDEHSLQCLKDPSEKTVPLDHSYTSESKKEILNPSNAPADRNDPANVSVPPMHLEEVLDMGPIETDEEVEEDAVSDTERGDGCDAGSDAEKAEIDSDCTELTEDSDMYDDSNFESSDQEDLCIVSDSDREDKKTERKATKGRGLNEKDDEELVDIESYEERSGKSTASQELKQQESIHQTQTANDSQDEYLVRHKKTKQERERRRTLKAQFRKLHLALDQGKHKMSNLRLLIQARKEIQTLTKQSDELMKMENKLKKKRAFFLQLASQLTGKTKESISQKLEEIITKQKALEGQNKAKPPPSHFTQIDSRPKLMENSTKTNNLKKANDPPARPVHLSPNSKPIDLSIPKPKTLGSQDNDKQNVPRPKQPVQTLNINTLPVSYTTQIVGSHIPSSLEQRERTRPNILSRSKSQSLPVSSSTEQVFVPQVIPILEAVVPCNQIITLGNPLQAGAITSLVEGQSATPGVASVSVSVPTVSHPMRVENPILQSQVLNINTPAKTVCIPKISSVVSLVPPEKFLVPPPVVLQKVDDPAVIQTQIACKAVGGIPQQNSSPDPNAKVLNNPLPQTMCKQPQQESQSNTSNGTGNQKGEGTGVANNGEQEDENLMSLLDELVFLNQQLNSESSQPQGGALHSTDSGTVPSELLTEKKAGVDRDDERSLSPLFLRLDEDLIASSNSKDDDIDLPPKVDDLVKVIFGSDSPPNSSETEIASADSEGTCGPMSDAKSDAPSPPPLMQMKTGGGDTAQPLKEQATMSWRPMPKLAPLGLKTQEAGQPKGTNPPAPKPGSKLPSLHSANT